MRRDRFTASLAALEPRPEISSVRQEDARLWAIAFGASLALGLLLLVLTAALFTILPIIFPSDPKESQRPGDWQNPEATLTITPDMFQKVPEKSAATFSPPPPPAVAAKPPEAVRTSEDQRGKRPDRPAFIGERDTEATSDQTPDPSAPPMPSQRGVQPRSDTDIETTESKYQDGELEKNAAAATPPMPPAAAAPPTPPEADPAMAPKEAASPNRPQEKLADPNAQTTDAEPTPAVPEPEKLLQGPNPVDVPVAKPTPEKIAKTLPPTPLADQETKPAPQEKPPATQKPTPAPGDPGFRGNQRKTAIRGSISRTGRSALDVADSPLGRYQAVISRAVEQEWQRNCVRHRDFITPGFLTVRFFVEASGKVKSVQFVGEMETGEVQKGFTLNSIRDADIPAMPKELRAEFAEESLELIFNFYF